MNCPLFSAHLFLSFIIYKMLNRTALYKSIVYTILNYIVHKIKLFNFCILYCTQESFV